MKKYIAAGGVVAVLAVGTAVGVNAFATSDARSTTAVTDSTQNPTAVHNDIDRAFAAKGMTYQGQPLTLAKVPEMIAAKPKLVTLHNAIPDCFGKAGYPVASKDEFISTYLVGDGAKQLSDAESQRVGELLDECTEAYESAYEVEYAALMNQAEL